MTRTAFAPCTLVLLALAAGCGGGGASARTLQKAVTLALTGPALTDGDATTLHGTTDPRAGIVALSAGSFFASSPDDFATFGIDVLLTPGENPFTLQTLDDRGRQRLLPGPSIRRETPLLFSTSGAAVVPKSGGAIVTLTKFPSQVVRVDSATGDRTVISSDVVGSGDPFGDVREVVPFDHGERFLVTTNFAVWSFVEADTGARTTVFPTGFGAIDASEDTHRDLLAYVDIFENDVRAFDPVTLTDTLVCDGQDGNAPALEFPVAIEYDSNGDRYVVLDLALPGIVAVDPDDGARKLLSDFDDAGEGPLLSGGALLAIDPSRKLAWTVAQPAGDVVEIALGSGLRRVVVPGDAALGPPLALARGLCLLDADHLVASVGEALVIIDLATPQRSELGRTRLGGGPDFGLGGFQLRPVFDRRGDRLLFVDAAGGIRAVDLATGDRTLLIDGADPDEPFFAADLSLDDASGRCFALSEDRESLAELDRRSFAARVISSPDIGSGDSFAGVLAVKADPANGRAFVVGGFPRVIAVVDLATGDRTTLAAPGDGGAVALQTLLDVDYDPLLDRVLAVDLSLLGEVIVIDPATGERSLLDQDAGPDVPAIGSLRILVDEADHALYGFTQADGSTPATVVRLDLDTHDRTIVSGSGVGRGPAMHRLEEVAVDPANGRLWVFDSSYRAMLQIDLASGDRLIVSR